MYGSAMGRRALAAVLVAVLAAALAVSGCGGSSDGSATQGFASLATQRCRTQTAVEGSEKPPPASMKLPLPASVADGLTAYVNSTDITLAAPKGWRCGSLVGMDGTLTMSVYPPGQKDPLASGSDSTGQGVTAQLITGCQGCVHDLVCSVFPSAHVVRTYARQGTTCPTPNPTAQTAQSLGPNAILFIDPPRVKGQGTPSGGAERAMGVVKLSDSFGNQAAGTAQITCTLPSGEADACAGIIGAALSAVLP
jgi:hypothetical protein